MTKISLKVSLKVEYISKIFQGFTEEIFNLLIVWW